MSSEPEEASLPKWPNWLGVVVDDLQGQRAFYRNVLGLEESDVGEDWVQFDMGGPNLFELSQRLDQDRPGDP